MRIRPFLFAAFAGLLPLAALAATSAADRSYVDATTYLTSDADIDAWYALTSNLRRNFDDICGDTFCEGDYSNIQSLDFRCSVEAHSGEIGRCVWVFAGSLADVDAASGRILVDARHWRCRTPLAPKTTIQALLQALAGTQPLRAPLPDNSRSIYDGLTDCL